MTSLLNRIATTLSPLYAPSEARMLARMVACHYSGLTLAQLLVSPLNHLLPPTIEKIEAAVDRLLKNEPVQYILGEEQFFGLTFAVSPSVLIPRPETSELVELILGHYQAPAGPLLDIGTGSGCMAVTLALKGSFSKVTAWDISLDALAVAARNAHSNRAEVEFERCDVLAVSPHEWSNHFEVIVSNPPYVRRSEAAQMSLNVLDHEPHTALFVDDADPLLFYRAIARFASVALKPKGALYVEINSQFPDETSALFEAVGLLHPHVYTDMQGRCRMIKAVKP